MYDGATAEIGMSAPGPGVNPLCGCDKNILGVMLFLAIAAGVIIGLALVGFDRAFNGYRK